jgi:hypothetical protein
MGQRRTDPPTTTPNAKVAARPSSRHVIAALDLASAIDSLNG